MAGGTVAAGLCLVLGFVALIATQDRENGAGSRVAESTASHDQPNGNVFGQADGLVAGHTIRLIRGDGTGRNATFSISRKGVWGLAWSFSCPARQHGTFVLNEDNTDSDYDQQVDSSGPSGHGLIWSSGDSGDHYVTVDSGCSWSVRIVLPRRRSRASASPRPESPPDSKSGNGDQNGSGDGQNGSSGGGQQQGSHPHHSPGPGPHPNPNPSQKTTHPGQANLSRRSVV